MANNMEKSEKYTWRNKIYSSYIIISIYNIAILHSVLPTLYSFLFLWLYIIRYVFLSYIKCVTSCAIQAREKKCHYVYHFSLLMCMIWCTHIQKAMSFSLTHVLFFRRRKERGSKKKKENAKRKVFVDVIYFRRRQWFQVLFYILKLWCSLF